MEKYEFLALDASSEQALMLVINPHGREGWRMVGYTAIPADSGTGWRHIAFLQRPVVKLDSLDSLIAAAAHPEATERAN
ncbi:MAG: hypothetical protein H7Z75_09450 [Ferruginibacter sp.]|nr:hypothetical protein [Cytophagales bacterium]